MNEDITIIVKKETGLIWRHLLQLLCNFDIFFDGRISDRDELNTTFRLRLREK